VQQTQERSEPSGDEWERPLAWSTICAPVVEWNDQEEVLDIWRDVRFPQVLEVVIVGRGTPAFHLGDNPSANG
jgi:hypothetical protein